MLIFSVHISIYFYFSCYYLQIRERLYGLVSPATDGIVTADQVIETIASTKCVRSAFNRDMEFHTFG